MTIEYFVFKTVRFLSLALVIIFLFLKYYSLPDMVAVFYNNQSKAEGFLPKDQFFYLIGGLLVGINLLTPILINIIKKLPVSFFESFLGKNVQKSTVNEIFENWINLIISSINIILVLSVLILGRLNSTEYTSNIGDYGWLLKLCFSVIIILFAYPFLKLKFSKPTADI